MSSPKRTYDWVWIVLIVIFIWYLGKSPPEFKMQYNVTPPPKQPDYSTPKEVTVQTYEHQESQLWDHVPDGPVPYHMIPKHTQEENQWKWGLQQHGKETD